MRTMNVRTRSGWRVVCTLTGGRFAEGMWGEGHVCRTSAAICAAKGGGSVDVWLYVSSGCCGRWLFKRYCTKRGAVEADHKESLMVARRGLECVCAVNEVAYLLAGCIYLCVNADFH